MVHVIVYSVPSESFNEEYAKAFSKKIAFAIYKNHEKSYLKFVVRPWLLSAL